jgi:hypothetical protein
LACFSSRFCSGGLRPSRIAHYVQRSALTERRYNAARLLMDSHVHARQHFFAEIERVPVGKANAPVAGRAADRFRRIRAVNAASFVIQFHPKNADGIVRPGGSSYALLLRSA